MKRLLLIPLILVLAAGCASSGSLPLAGTPAAQDVSDALGQLADHPLMVRLDRDALDTLAWVNGPDGPKDPLRQFQATMCPTAVQLSRADFKQKVAMVQAMLAAPATDPTKSGTGPEIILYLTKLRYSTQQGMDPKAQLEQLKTDIAARVTAVVDSCRSIVPLKQIDEVVKLANKAGLAIGTGGAGLPLMGLMP